MTQHSNSIPTPKTAPAGTKVFVTEEVWYEPYRGKELEILEWDRSGDAWFEACGGYDGGICISAQDLRMIATECNKFSEENRPKIGQKVRLIYAEDGEAEEFLGQTFTVLADDEDFCPILLDCPAFEHGLYVHLSDIESVEESDTSVEQDLPPQDLLQQNPYALPCDFKVGDEVTCLMFGDGVVEEIYPGSSYSVRVQVSGDSSRTFSADGKYQDHVNRTLFHKGTVKLVAVEQQYKPEYHEWQWLYAMADGKITELRVKQDYKDRVVDTDGRVFKKSDFTFHLPA